MVTNTYGRNTGGYTFKEAVELAQRYQRDNKSDKYDITYSVKEMGYGSDGRYYIEERMEEKNKGEQPKNTTRNSR